MNFFVHIRVLLLRLNQQNQLCSGWATKGLIAEAEQGWALKWPATCNLKVKYGSLGSPITVYSLMGTLQTRILGAQRASLCSTVPQCGKELDMEHGQITVFAPVWHVQSDLWLTHMNHRVNTSVLSVHDTHKVALCTVQWNSFLKA